MLANREINDLIQEFSKLKNPNKTIGVNQVEVTKISQQKIAACKKFCDFYKTQINNEEYESYLQMGLVSRRNQVLNNRINDNDFLEAIKVFEFQLFSLLKQKIYFYMMHKTELTNLVSEDSVKCESFADHEISLVLSLKGTGFHNQESIVAHNNALTKETLLLMREAINNVMLNAKNDKSFQACRENAAKVATFLFYWRNKLPLLKDNVPRPLLKNIILEVDNVKTAEDSVERKGFSK